MRNITRLIARVGVSCGLAGGGGDQGWLSASQKYTEYVQRNLGF
jgi:hypothetical protein